MSDCGAFLSWIVRRLRLLRLRLSPPDEPEPARPSEPLERILSPDGQLRLIVYRRADGLYEYGVDRYWIDDLPEYDHHYEYWAPHRRSGLFDSAETARRDAALLFPWIDGEEEGGAEGPS